MRVKAQIDFIKYHYETECTVRWNENLSETKIKNASITAVHLLRMVDILELI